MESVELVSGTQKSGRQRMTRLEKKWQCRSSNARHGVLLKSSEGRVGMASRAGMNHSRSGPTADHWNSSVGCIV